MRINNINSQASFNSRYVIRRSLSEILVDNKPRTVETTTIEKTGLAYIAGVFQNIYEFFTRKLISDNRLVHEKVKILEGRNVNKQGLIYILPQEVSGKFLTTKKEFVQYYSPLPGKTYINVTKPDKTGISIDISGGIQGTTHSEIERLISQKNPKMPKHRELGDVIISQSAE